MKKNILLSGLVALLAIFSGCEMNEEPKSEASVDMVFSSENGLKTYTYSFYNVLPSRGSAFRRDATADYGVKIPWVVWRLALILRIARRVGHGRLFVI